jgi:tRNA-specific 2-thiouridylase
MTENLKPRALCLMSGGLDSILAARVLKEQEIDVTGIIFTSPFFGSRKAEEAAENLGIGLIIEDLTSEHLALVKNPPSGYGKWMNPCIDCHALMIRRAGEILRRDKYDMIATGEVLGERPMSQNRQSLDTVARLSGCGDLLLRPLSARLLPPTEPERAGIVDRKRLFAIEGRSRRPQMALAKAFGIESYAQPAGGCLLTDPHFASRLSELFEANPDACVENVLLLKLGRHFRLPSGVKAIVGRNKKENEEIRLHMREGRTLIISDIMPGPVTLVLSENEKDFELAAKLCASYADHDFVEIDMEMISSEGKRRIKAIPSQRSEFKGMKI